MFYELPYSGMPRTGTYLSSHTSVCSALEYSNILPVSSEITDGALEHFQCTASFKNVVWRRRLSQEGVNKMNPRGKKGNETVSF